MKARPILFSTPMIRALLDGSKGMTRRIVKPQPDLDVMETYSAYSGSYYGRDAKPELFDGEWSFCIPGASIGGWKCPYGQTGDLLWIREAWRLYDAVDECGCSEAPCGCPLTGTPLYRATHDDSESKWKPSIHMKRTYSRITLEITDICIERLKDISEDDAKAEGVFHDIATNRYHYAENKGAALIHANGAFVALWQSINGLDSWDKNPWVWVVKFNVHNVNIDDFIGA